MYTSRFDTMVLCCGCAALLSVADGQTGDKPKALPGVEVTLRFSVDELDPLKPGDSFVECSVNNKSPKAVRVPVGYVPGFNAPISLHSNSRYGLRLVLWGEKIEQKIKLVEPGSEVVVFKDQLKDVLLLEMHKEKPLLPKDRRYLWTWDA